MPCLVPARAGQAKDKILRVGCPFSFYNSETVFAIVRGVVKSACNLAVVGLKLDSAFISGTPSLFAYGHNHNTRAAIRGRVLSFSLFLLGWSGRFGWRHHG